MNLCCAYFVKFSRTSLNRKFKYTFTYILVQNKARHVKKALGGEANTARWL